MLTLATQLIANREVILIGTTFSLISDAQPKQKGPVMNVTPGM